MRKIYNQPVTDILEMQTENLMLTVSTNKSGGGGIAHSPGRIPGTGI
ncbi:MAG: hypothetical protein IJ204_03395 [Paludibacteraceae bacterium]|nr:hypothetical protein [Paludibacteraceae bacterium]